MSKPRPERTFREAAQGGRLALTAELTLRRESNAADIRRQAATLGPAVDALQINENPWAWVQMSPLAACGLLLEAGVDPVPIMTCRDRNRIALMGDLLGLRALGVTSVLLTRGHRVPKAHPLEARTVFDLSGRELIAMGGEMNSDESAAPGEKLFIGTGACARRPAPNWRAESLQARAAAGAEFLQTQLCFNVDLLRDWMARLVELKLTWKYAVIVSLTPLPSAETALWVKERLRDSTIPKALIKRLEGSVNPEEEGIQLCAEAMQEVSEIPGVSGIHLMTTGNPESIVAAIEASGLRGAP